MTRLISFLFALAALMAPLSTLAEPVAVCKGDKCEISKADWEKLQEFHKEVRKYVAEVDRMFMEQAQAFASTLGSLAACKAKLQEVNS